MGRCFIVGLCLLLTAATAVVCGSRSDDPIGVAVSPQNLLLGESQGGSVVVHTDVPYKDVDRSSVTLNGIPSVATKADLRGCLVAYFDEAAIKAIVAPPSATLTLSGSKNDGTTFSGSDTVKVTEK